MHKIEIRAFFELLRSGLWEKRVEDVSIFPLSQDVWEKVMDIAREQTVLGLIYRGIQNLPKEFHPQRVVLMDLVVEMDRVERLNKKVNGFIGELLGGYKKIGVSPILQKGQGVAMFYNYPLLRSCGDIDFFIKGEEEFCKIKEFLKSKIQVYSMPDNSFMYNYKGIEVENHRELIDISNPFKKKYIKSLIDEYGFKEFDIDGVFVYIPSPMLNLVMLNTHIMKHAFGWGIGLRQICDIARAYYKLNRDFNSEELERIYKELGIKKWSGLLHSFLVKYVGLDRDYLPYKERFVDCEKLLEVVLSGGNFGFNLRDVAENKKAVVRKANTFNSFFKRSLFSLKYAPKECLWLVFSLLKGQL